MPFTLSEVIPWGRSYDEYLEIFALSRVDLDKRILGCGDGPAGFNAEATRRGHRVVSCDPVYRFDADQIRGRVEIVCGTMIDQLYRNQWDYLWNRFRSPEDLVQYRLGVMNLFLDDYPRGKREGRYRIAGLPCLPFRDAEFDLALCSHLLFTYTAQLPIEFHLRGILEMCRVAREVRIFPLLGLDRRVSCHLAPALSNLRGCGLKSTVQKVDYEFQRGANAFLRIGE
jgi:hypothetical protein